MEREPILDHVEEKIVEGNNLLWLKAYFQSSGLSLLLISLIWIGLEFAFTGERHESGIDTVIAFITAIAIGYFYAQHAVAKEANKQLSQTMEKQMQRLEEQNEMIQKLWAIKKPRQ